MLPPELVLRPSRQARYWWLAAHLLALASLLAVPAGWPLTLLPLIAVHGLLTAPQRLPPYRLRVTQDGVLLVTPGRGEECCAVLGSSLVQPPWLVLVLQPARGKRVRLVLWPDSASAEVLRQWRVWLLWSVAGAGGYPPVDQGK
ncbi:protein YgfX [Chitinilyticum piscinae]|uniref:Toxin CptA n=1 Tax=Chitinilyticum piscinae TaxID=2866724 RepID=A0A8J7FL53_9NEIS|nr:protein YgfX [Chitinilyticum piscinae]MBE9609822.1 hypothetical protein [Chitinilyticum piscinae]